MKFSEHLAFLREQEGLLQKDLAKALGISLHAYQRFEYGEQEPRLAVLAKLADFYDLSLDALVGRRRSVRVTALLENTAGREGLCAAHGLSLYIETPRHKILFDMGPGDEFLSNAEALGVDLTAVDLAVLSHGHDDHGGGLAAFCRVNDHAPIYLHRSAFGPYYILSDDRDPAYIGLPLGLEEFRYRFIFTDRETVIDRELTLFAEPPAVFDAMAASGRLAEKVGTGFQPDAFRHEQNLLIRAAGRTVLVAGCAHRGVVNILTAAKSKLGEYPDVFFGGFHLFQLPEGEAASDKLIDETGRALLPGKTVYYTGHCTGTYAYDRLQAILGQRLRPLTGGMTADIGEGVEDSASNEL